jgi:crotonobetainyl-CoA:carnitine CoA-transferase CaiB-like acyl-CoA transferase
MGILSGLRVIDMSQGVPTAVATMLLAEAGAEVVKVEPPTGDWTRGQAGFATWNRSKRSVVLDLDLSTDGEALARLIQSADVLVHNERPAAAAALGIDDDSLRRRHPRLVVCAVTRAPVGHADEGRPYDPMLAEARIGFMGEQPGYRPGPVFLRYPISTYGTVYLVLAGVLSRLIARERTGSGGPAHTSLVQGGLSQLMMKWSMATRPTPQLEGASRDPGRASLFECGDGQWIHVMSAIEGSPLMAKTLAEMGPDEVTRLSDAADAGTWSARYPNFGANLAAFLRHPAEEWLDDFWANDIAVQPSLPPGAVFFDEQARINGYVVEVDDPVHGKTRQAGNGLHVNPPTAVQRPAPTLGEGTQEILGNLGSNPPAPETDGVGTSGLRFPSRASESSTSASSWRGRTRRCSSPTWGPTSSRSSGPRAIPCGTPSGSSPGANGESDRSRSTSGHLMPAPSSPSSCSRQTWSTTTSAFRRPGASASTTRPSARSSRTSSSGT